MLSTQSVIGTILECVFYHLFESFFLPAVNSSLAPGRFSILHVPNADWKSREYNKLKYKFAITSLRHFGP